MVKVDITPRSFAEFMATLKRFETEMKISMKDMGKKQAALICEDMARFTPGLVKGGGQGLTNDAKTAGEGAVDGDIRKMFIAVGDRNVSTQKAIVFRNLAYATQTNNRALFDNIISRSKIDTLRISPIMSKILNDPDYDRAFRKARNYLNRVPVKSNEYGLSYEYNLRQHHDRIKAKFGGRIKRDQRIGEPRVLVESKGVLDDYIKERQLAVGKTKAGWLAALQKLSMPSNKHGPVLYGKDLRKAGWIARHVSGNGYAMEKESGKEFSITIGNLIGNINAIADQANTMALALGNRDRQMLSDLQKNTERVLRQMNRK